MVILWIIGGMLMLLGFAIGLAIIGSAVLAIIGAGVALFAGAWLDILFQKRRP